LNRTIAVTGAMNQQGEGQAAGGVGGVNGKIKGFSETCRDGRP